MKLSYHRWDFEWQVHSLVWRLFCWNSKEIIKRDYGSSCLLFFLTLRYRYHTRDFNRHFYKLSMSVVIDHQHNLGGLYPHLFDADNKTINTSFRYVQRNSPAFIWSMGSWAVCGESVLLSTNWNCEISLMQARLWTLWLSWTYEIFIDPASAWMVCLLGWPLLIWVSRN